jgi:hypothetical protein
MPSATAKGGSMRSHSAPSVEICHYVAAQFGLATGPLVAAAQWQAGNDVGVVGAAIVADEKALILVRSCRLVHGRGALHRGVDRQIADIVVVELQFQLVGERQCVEPAGCGKGALDDLVGYAVVQRIEEADFGAGAPDLGGDPVQRTLFPAK